MEIDNDNEANRSNDRYTEQDLSGTTQVDIEMMDVSEQMGPAQSTLDPTGTDDDDDDDDDDPYTFDIGISSRDLDEILRFPGVKLHCLSPVQLTNSLPTDNSWLGAIVPTEARVGESVVSYIRRPAAPTAPADGAVAGHAGGNDVGTNAADQAAFSGYSENAGVMLEDTGDVEPIAFANLSVLAWSTRYALIVTAMGQTSITDGETEQQEQAVDRELVIPASYDPCSRSVYSVHVQRTLAHRLRFAARLPGESEYPDKYDPRKDWPDEFAKRFTNPHGVFVSIPFQVTPSDGTEQKSSFLVSPNKALEAIRLINDRQDASETLGSRHDPALDHFNSASDPAAEIERADLGCSDGVVSRQQVISWSPAIRLKGMLQDAPRISPRPAANLLSRRIQEMQNTRPTPMRLAHQAEARQGWSSVQGLSDGSHLQYTECKTGMFVRIRLDPTTETCCVT